MKKVLLMATLMFQIGFARPYSIKDKYDEVIATVEKPFKKDLYSNKLIMGVDSYGNGYIEINRDDYISDFKIKGGDVVYKTPESFYYRRYKYEMDMRVFFELSDHDKELLESNNEILLLATRRNTFGSGEYLDKIKLRRYK